MNANELADAMEIRASIRRKATSRKSVTEGANDRLADQLDQAATMLRQQQSEIEALKQIIDANNLSQNIGQFVKPTNEPVAWTNQYNLKANKEDKCGQFWDKPYFDGDIPLYTHPVKELTDEEINVVAILQDAEIVPVGHEIWKTGEEFNKYKRIVLATTKALRKAQEKC